MTAGGASGAGWNTAPRGFLELAVEVLRAQRASGRRARDLLAERFRGREFDGASRARIARAVYRTVQQERRAAFGLGGLERIPAGLREPALLFATLLLDRELRPERAEAAMRLFGPAAIDWALVGRTDARIGRVEDPAARFALRHSMPDWIAARLLDECGDGAEALATALNAEPPRTIRANLLRTPDRDALAEELRAAGVATEPTRFAPHGLVVDGTVALYELDAFREGRFEQQDEASQLCALVVAPPPRGRILDACAGGGGKALALAAELQNRGEILAVDAHDRRLAGLTPRRRRAGVDVIRSVHVARGAWPPTVAKFARRADRILIDAPCSGIGSWRRRTDARWSLDPDGCAAMRRTQSELLDRAIAHLRPGARVIYATCTVFRDENEDQIEAALARHPELETVRVAEILGRERALPITDPSGTFLRLRPELHGTDGFFAAVLRRPK